MVKPCELCGGNAGVIVDGSHMLCRFRSDMGQPTPNLGLRCEACNGQGRTGNAVLIDPNQKALDAAFPKCRECDGKGYVEVGARCRQCGKFGPSGYTTTCGRSECQEAEHRANALRNKPKRRRSMNRG